MARSRYRLIQKRTLLFFREFFLEVIEWDRVENHVAGKKKGGGMLPSNDHLNISL
jgi:hypothetical protein